MFIQSLRTALQRTEVHVNTVTRYIRQALSVFASCQQTLPSTEKQKIISTIFSRTHPERVRPGSVLTVNLTHAPTGVLISVRRRGPDTSFRPPERGAAHGCWDVILCQLVKEIIVVSRAGGKAADEKKKRKGMRRAKLFHLCDSPEKMSGIFT